MNINHPIIILGSTGSIGTQSIDVAQKNNIPVVALSANQNADLVENQARKLKVSFCAMADEGAAKDLKIKLADTNISVYSGVEGICEMVERASAKTVINSIIGEAGLMPTLSTIKSGKTLALANKESLVVAGETVMAEATKNNVAVVPVDSEHCAIHQCLKCGSEREVKKLILTASGGPFYGKKFEDIKNVTISEVLAHPTWSMGAKITVDSATLMNKGFEVIEAMHLFGVPADQIDVLVHRESIIHSMVEYIDNSVIAQMSTPDMRFCIQYALSYPDRIDSVSPALDLATVGTLTFGKPDTDTFSLLSLAFHAAENGGAIPAVLNAANEVAVEKFLKGRISFPRITEIVTAVVSKMSYAKELHALDDIIRADKEARKFAYEL
jgi:1-deoxy-D-xylulose-5-phosphate reductoisomerase